jgi:hypothetical protein
MIHLPGATRLASNHDCDSLLAALASKVFPDIITSVAVARWQWSRYSYFSLSKIRAPVRTPRHPWLYPLGLRTVKYLGEGKSEGSTVVCDGYPDW